MLNRAELPGALYTAEQSRALDRTAIEQFGIPGFRLMQRAGHAAFVELMAHWPGLRRLTVAVGSGNNGGDGLIMAGLARQQGLEVQVLVVRDHFEDGLQGEALSAWQWAQAVGVELTRWQPGLKLQGEVLVDALLGTGLTGPVRGESAELIAQLNRSTRPVLAVDIPSGLCSDTGRVLGVAVRADLTLTFIALKQGLLTHEGVDHCGQVLFDSLMLPDEVYEEVAMSAFRTDRDDLAKLLPPRRRSSHKGQFGHVMVVGGDHGMGGAALMAAEAAARSGAGLVSLATRPEHVTAALTRAPEVMVAGVNSGQDIQPLLARPDVLVVGPGLGQSAWADQLLQQALNTGLPLVLDADALNLLAHRNLAGREHDWILTPHPGEAARMLGWETHEVQQDRFAAVRALQARFGGTVVLKGAGSLSCDGDAVHLCSAGNPGMACGGMGDVLSGIIGALRAQRLSAVDAARAGVYAHARAADLCAADQGERGLLATDLIARVRRVLSSLD
ncbi:NAD(P)H-hydrate dehydratase [Marinobacterium weihaiense]|uniref:Bifunctional NAD(P)H-hydrate repair enzyme n=1 Tax=Marinobacterium weihaiense TaxID=2851016 RepID=A0ABS6MCT1_9GAMM|nr:NAD(P)H-hydrate dehydratase [Marinobacterium weihaiense]MBV0934102.1 NAD(P)H-hydrate dehydratase [Marinobacterium weihaiense]